MKMLKYLLLFITLCVGSCTTANAENWYEDNNLATAGGLPLDFNSRTQITNSFSKMDVYYLRISTMRQLSDIQLRGLSNTLRQYGIKLAIDNTDATWGGCRLNRNYSRTINDITKLKQLGFDVKYIGLQSVLSKPYTKRDGKCNDYRFVDTVHILERYKDILTFYEQVQPRFRDISIGIIDALPAKNKPYYRAAYNDISHGLKIRGYKLGFIHLDVPLSYPRERLNGVTYQSLASDISYINSLGTKSGIFFASNKGGRTSASAVSEYKIDGVVNMIKYGVNPHHWVSAGWFPYPKQSAPDNDLYTSLGIFNVITQILRASK